MKVVDCCGVQGSRERDIWGEVGGISNRSVPVVGPDRPCDYLHSHSWAEPAGRAFAKEALLTALKDSAHAYLQLCCVRNMQELGISPTFDSCHKSGKLW